MHYRVMLSAVLIFCCLSGQKATALETLTMDVWDPWAPEWAISEFKSLIKKKYNKEVKVVVRYVYSPNDYYDRVRANQTDIVSLSHNLTRDDKFNFIGKNLIIPIDRSILTNLNLVESSFLTKPFITDKDNLYGIPFASGAYSLLYKKAYFKKSPRELESFVGTKVSWTLHHFKRLL